MDGLTSDAICNGRIQIRQPKNGYRFSIDSVLLAAHVDIGSEDRVLDLGTGCGVIPLILAHRYPQNRFYGIEIQEPLLKAAQDNVVSNRMQDTVDIFQMDIKAVNRKSIREPIHVVVTNPPYRSIGSGRINPDSQRAVARHEIKVKLADIIQAADRMLELTGRLIMVYPSQRLGELLTMMQTSRMEPKYLRMIHSRRTSEANRVLVLGIKGARPGLKIAPPLFVYDADGNYTREVQTMLADSTSDFTPASGH